METNTLQELLLDTMPRWHYWIAKPFKSLLDDGVSLGMYYCIQTLRQHGESMTMSELAGAMHCSKQQMTRTVERLAGCGFVERMTDPCDRRIIRLQLTQSGRDYTGQFLEQDCAYYHRLIGSLSPQQQEELYGALQTLNAI
ncbi:MAG: MarR family transcriptional regulator, partial [Oscillospiraceae bacterium]|nr:MarR family transcriptional regulator [Oscillospiraceae bacterium]